MCFFLVVVTSLERQVIGICSIPCKGKNWGGKYFLIQPDGHAQRQSGSSGSVPKWEERELPPKGETAAHRVVNLCCPLCEPAPFH